MPKNKDKIQSDIQQRISQLEHENVTLMNQIQNLRNKLSELNNELNPEMIHRRLHKLESNNEEIAATTIQNRQAHAQFSLDVGNQLVETFVTQQTIYEEFQRLQRRLLTVERQNQIMSDLIRIQNQNGLLLSNRVSVPSPGSSTGQQDTSSPSSSYYFSPCNTYTATENSAEPKSGEDYLNIQYYRIDFTDYRESLGNVDLIDMPVTGSLSGDESVTRSFETQKYHNRVQYEMDERHGVTLFDMSKCGRTSDDSALSCHQRDDGYHSTSQEGAIATDWTTICNAGRSSTVFHDDKARYLILTRHLQKSRGRSLREVPSSISKDPIVVTGSLDLETHIFNRTLRQRQRVQRDCHTSLSDKDPNDAIMEVFSDTELYGTRFCIDSDIDEMEDADRIFETRKLKPLKRSFHYAPQRLIKAESRHVSSLPPLIENVAERERRIEIKSSSKRSRILPGHKPVVGTSLNTRAVVSVHQPEGLLPVLELRQVSIDDGYTPDQEESYHEDDEGVRISRGGHHCTTYYDHKFVENYGTH